MRFIRNSLVELVHLVFACIPGCGQMCQGYMKRGISQTIITSVLLFIAVFLEMGVLSVLIAPLWLYSFFDSFNLRRQIREGAAPEDDYLFGLSDIDSQRLNQILNRRGSLIGWVLIVVGLYNLYQIFARRLLGALRSAFPFFDWIYSLLVWDAPRIMGTVLIIALGIWFIKGPKVLKSDNIGTVYPTPENPGKPPKMKATPWTEAEEQFHKEPEPQAPEVPEISEVPQAPEVLPVTLTWKSEFEVEKFEKENGEAEKEEKRDSQ